MKQMGCTQPTYSTAGENNVLYLIAPSARWPQVISFLLATIAIGACSAGGAPPAAPQTWYLAIEEQPASSTLQIFANGTEGTLVDDAGVLHAVDSIRGGSADGPFDFREIGSSGDSWFQGTILDGVVFGRFAQKNGDQLPATSDFTNHFTGWNRATYEQSLTPRVFDLLLDGTERVTLRFDSAPAGNPKQFVGSIKSYATIAFGIKSEKEQLDVDGVQLSRERRSERPARVARDAIRNPELWAPGKERRRSERLAGADTRHFTGTDDGWRARSFDADQHEGERPQLSSPISFVRGSG